MYQLSYWKGTLENSVEVMQSKRIKKVSDIPHVLRPIPSECDYVSLDRTDKQSPMFKVVWMRPYRLSK